MVGVNTRNPHDGTAAVQFSINFYAQNARDFYLRNKKILQTDDLNDLLGKISAAIESGTLNNPENHSGKREFGSNIVEFCSELHERALVVI
ncbi:hypothetical protein [Pseudomonas sp. GM78]|uniref:hypothetical protein n=1 Tax=Pseudomonas sp. GM78 TaxID=1144337 RepID=UPI0012F92B4D|nr:hypothetical protein [Pseudomonas sp. GM78]